VNAVLRDITSVVAEIGERQHDDRQPRGSDVGRHACRRHTSDAFRAHRIDPDRPGDVLDALLAHVFEGVGEPVADVVADRARDADAAGGGQPLQPCGDVDAVAINVAAVNDHVAEIDADAEAQSVYLGEIQIAAGHRALDLARTAHRIDDAGEF